MKKNKKTLLLFTGIILFVLISGSGSSFDYMCKYSAVGDECGELGTHCCDGNLDADEECDDGIHNGVICDNSEEDCSYCSLSCEIINLKGPDDDGDYNRDKDSGNSRRIRLQQFCDVNWVCSGWNECDNGIMTRKCQDTNRCDYSYNKPIEQTGCEISLSINNNKILILKNKIYNLQSEIKFFVI